MSQLKKEMNSLFKDIKMIDNNEIDEISNISKAECYPQEDGLENCEMYIRNKCNKDIQVANIKNILFKFINPLTESQHRNRIYLETDEIPTKITKYPTEEGGFENCFHSWPFINQLKCEYITFDMDDKKLKSFLSPEEVRKLTTDESIDKVRILRCG